MLQKILLALSLCGLLAGCALPAAVAAPTPYPPAYLPTVIYLTAQSINATHSAGITPTVTPTLTAVPTLTTPLPTITPTPGPGIPLAEIQINAPGPMSKIVSPVEVHAQVMGDQSYKVEVVLYDEQGQVISHPPLLLFSSGFGGPVSLKLPFEIRAAGENGVVQISARDAHGVLQSLNSVRVVLLSSGVSQINPPGNTIYERVVFYDLPPKTKVSGGVLSVKGRFTPLNSHKPVIAELVGLDGKTILSQRVLQFAGLAEQTFDTTLPYKVTTATPARLFLYQDDDVIDGRGYVYSQPIALNP